MTVTPQRHATYTRIMPVEELFVHLHRLKLRLDRAEGCISELVGEKIRSRASWCLFYKSYSPIYVSIRLIFVIKIFNISAFSSF